MTVYAYDTEFLENGSTIELISIGIVADDGREYYAVNSDMPKDRITKNDWLMQNVVPSLPGSKPYRLDGSTAWIWALSCRDVVVKPHWVIANEVREFLTSAGEPELWADYCAYDHVVLCQLWGRMIDLPQGIPMWTHDLQQLAETSGTNGWPEQHSGLHNALEDAKHVMACLDYATYGTVNRCDEAVR